MSATEQSSSTLNDKGLYESKWPLIDSDPHFKRVIGYLRPSDYATFAGLTALGPAAMLWLDKYGPQNFKGNKPAFTTAMKTSFWFGALGAFFYVYQKSSMRFYGMLENAREAELDMQEMTERARQGLPLYGKSIMPEHIQQSAAANSQFSAVLMGFLPWFNFVNHPYHGVDTSKYYIAAGVPVPGSEEKVETA
ncbi:hypothetical protein GQ42DRAFT_161705 [Ramicandelaber brevisporus]|nr:hypothetical protein GQ42DRAFT_161705 [Ramicandelaber brevisporus]